MNTILPARWIKYRKDMSYSNTLLDRLYPFGKSGGQGIALLGPASW